VETNSRCAVSYPFKVLNRTLVSSHVGGGDFYRSIPFEVTRGTGCEATFYWGSLFEMTWEYLLWGFRSVCARLVVKRGAASGFHCIVGTRMIGSVTEFACIGV
jgi:hypothetical protein